MVSSSSKELSLRGNDLLNYVTAGNAEFIIEGGENNVKFQFKILRPLNSTSKIYFVYFYDNRNSAYSGHLRYIDNKFAFTQGEKGNLTLKDLPIKALVWTLNHAHNLPDNVVVYHTGRCGRCGRQLTDADSILRGLGPECFKKSLFG